MAAAVLPALHIIPFHDGYRIEWLNSVTYTRFRFVSRNRAAYTTSTGGERILDPIIQGVELVGLLDANGDPLIDPTPGDFNSVTTLEMNAAAAGNPFASVSNPRNFLQQFWLQVEDADGNITNFDPNNPNALFPPAPAVAQGVYAVGGVFQTIPDPGRTQIILPRPVPLSEAHKITLESLEEAYMAFIPRRLRCEWDGNLGRLARLIGAADDDAVESVRKIAEEVYSTTTVNAVGELEREFFDIGRGCYEPSTALDVRRRAILARKRSRGGNTRLYVENLMTTLGFVGVEVIETQGTRVGALNAGSRLQRSAVWLRWATSTAAITPTLSALECILSETRQTGVNYFIAQTGGVAPAAVTFKQVP